MRGKPWQLELLLPNDHIWWSGSPWKLLVKILIPRPHLRPIQNFYRRGLGISIFKVIQVILGCGQH